jgi:hypothetical protein
MSQDERMSEGEARRLIEHSVPCVPARASVLGYSDREGQRHVVGILSFAINDQLLTILRLDLAGMRWLAREINECLKTMERLEAAPNN